MTAWLNGYRHLTAGSRHPLATAGLVTLGLVPLTLLVEPWEMSRGYFRLNRGYRVGYNALMTPVLMGGPIVAFEALRRSPGIERPEAAWKGACDVPETVAAT